MIKALIRKIVSSINTKIEKHHLSKLENSILYTKGNYVKRSNTEPLATPPVKLLAFYLPQFHSIPENDQWWGKGFTEWTNVRPSKPLYENHYQPHVPDELGYYDLLDIETQKKQIALARQYGIYGFCFYFYWFNEHRLLEHPLLNYLKNEDLVLSFCICWANESWTRRWNGLDKEILIKQNHNEQDDIAFISYISKYLKDKRYIRIDNKPLLIIYRPSLFPNIKDTVAKWRNWCRDNNIGEIYICYTQSFENPNPDAYGMDAAIEFPPNHTNPPNITKRIKPLSKNFSGKVYDWSVYLKRSANYTKPDYKLFRGVCPSWDNTARRKNNSTSFINSSPFGYQQWLFRASVDTMKRFKNPSERIVFINAWNEWAEGAHLEPDTKYGFAWLEATKIALQKAFIFNKTLTHNQANKLAIVIHVYYIDLLPEIVHYLKQLNGVKFKLYISTPNENAVRTILENNGFDCYIEKSNNQGRDILPFIQIMKQVQIDGYELIIKVHTKKSLHRVDGDAWRLDLYNKLLNIQSIESGIKQFQEDPSLGILGPDDHVLPMSYYFGSNAENVIKISHRLGVSATELLTLNFIAGSMFMAKVSALEPILSLGLNIEDFEVEAGQVDGTLAHAIERSFAVSAHSIGLRVKSFSDKYEKNLDYKYAKSQVEKINLNHVH